MSTDEWYALRGAGTKYRLDNVRGWEHLFGVVNRARRAGHSWQAITRATGLPYRAVRSLAP